VMGQEPKSMAGSIVMCPPSALGDRWSRRFADPVSVFASGWMRVRGRARQRGVELPLVVSDHADWPELIDTIVATGAEEIWVTHGREDALVHHLATLGRKARALALVGRDEEAE
jgi:putative mRNA 3-end processing factor